MVMDVKGVMNWGGTVAVMMILSGVEVAGETRPHATWSVSKLLFR